jgi:sulfane dehydrogenase subunit SoxC
MSSFNGGASRLSRRGLLKYATAAAGALTAKAAMASPAVEDSLADVPPRDVGDDLGPLSPRSKFVKLARIPEGGPGARNVDTSEVMQAIPISTLTSTGC